MNDRAQRLFRSQHPDPTRNAFLMMRFDSGTPMRQMNSVIRNAGIDLGLDIIRADDVDYTGELWSNVTLCIENCTLGIAIFDGVSGARECDFNVCLELGYMLALNKPCLLLREQRLGPPPAMIANRFHVPFDAHDIETTMAPAARKWLADQQRLRQTPHAPPAV